MYIVYYFISIRYKTTIRNWRTKSKHATSCNLICTTNTQYNTQYVPSILTIMSYTSSDSWVAPAYVTSVEYLVVGGGGGGGGATTISSDSKYGGNGGSGKIILKYYI